MKQTGMSLRKTQAMRVAMPVSTSVWPEFSASRISLVSTSFPGLFSALLSAEKSPGNEVGLACGGVVVAFAKKIPHRYSIWVLNAWQTFHVFCRISTALFCLFWLARVVTHRIQIKVCGHVKPNTFGFSTSM